MAGPKRSLRFRAGEVGFVFYEESSGFPGMVIETTTFAFSTIGDAAAWLKERFDNPSPRPAEARPEAVSEVADCKFRQAERALVGQRWTVDQADQLCSLVRVGAGAAG